jgi:hypothetical protein
MPLDVPASSSAGAKAPVDKAPSDHLYWARSSSINAAPPPKALSAEEAKALEAASSQTGGSAWNKGGSTWEEKKINQWAIDLLTEELLPNITYELPAAGGAAAPEVPAAATEVPGVERMVVRVASVGHVKGDTTYVLSRGKQKCIFELSLKLKLEMDIYQGGELKTIVTGKVTIPEVTNDDLDEPKLPDHKCACDQTLWKPFFEKAARHVWPGVKGSLESLVEQAKAKWR